MISDITASSSVVNQYKYLKTHYKIIMWGKVGEWDISDICSTDVKVPLKSGITCKQTV